MDFFNSVGFRLPARKDPASFLQEVTSVKDQEVRLLLTSLALVSAADCMPEAQTENLCWCDIWSYSSRH